MASPKTRTKWNTDQEKVLLEAVKQYPHNLQFSFLISSIATGKTQRAVENRWYKILRRKEDIYTITTDYVSVGNSKNHFKRYIPQESVLKRFLINVGNVFKKRRERVSC